MRRIVYGALGVLVVGVLFVQAFPKLTWVMVATAGVGVVAYSKLRK